MNEDIFKINPYELSKRLRTMAGEADLGAIATQDGYWQGWQAGIGAHLSTLNWAAEMIDMLADANATLRSEAM